LLTRAFYFNCWALRYCVLFYLFFFPLITVYGFCSLGLFCLANIFMSVQQWVGGENIPDPGKIKTQTAG
jgi:hypothetical protein